MKKIFINLLFIFVVILFSLKVSAVEFNLLVLPVDLFSVCDNYYCFSEPSNIIADDVISNLSEYKNINVINLYKVRQKLETNTALKSQTQILLKDYASTDKVNFQILDQLANEFNVKSVLLINSYTSNDKVATRRNLWNILEITSAFQMRYPFEFKTSALLTDCVNNIVMWSGKYSKEVTDNEGYFSASNQIEAYSQLEKIKEYSKVNLSQNISQNVFMRFFPREVRTFFVQPQKPQDESSAKTFVPNALEHLSKPKEYSKFEFETQDSADDFIFEF